MKVLDNSTYPDLLHNILIEYSKVDFKEHCNLETPLTDIAFIELKVEGAELFAMVLIKKRTKYKELVTNFDFSEQLSADQIIYIHKVEVLESRVVLNNDAVEISSHRLSAAHEEQLYKHV